MSNPVSIIKTTEPAGTITITDEIIDHVTELFKRKYSAAFHGKTFNVGDIINITFVSNTKHLVKDVNGNWPSNLK